MTLRLDGYRKCRVPRPKARRERRAAISRLSQFSNDEGERLCASTLTDSITEEDIVSHADLIAVIEYRGARHRDQQRIEKLDLAPIVLHQRREPPANAEVQPR